MTNIKGHNAPYDRLAAIYDQRWLAYIDSTLGFLKNYMQVTGDESILNVGCGTGELERLLLADHPQLKLVGVDISAEMLAIARSKFLDNPQVELINASAIALPFANQSFDLVVTASALHYFDNPVIALGEMNRVLKPTGRLIVMDWCRDYWYCQVLDLVLKLVETGYKSAYTQTELNNFLDQVGLIGSNPQKFTVPPLWGMMAVTGNPKTKKSV
jgi:ubiquinone/menaquinone biosynthesis C-methylase UbiE